jgi:hypothetical protein
LFTAAVYFQIAAIVACRARPLTTRSAPVS